MEPLPAELRQKQLLLCFRAMTGSAKACPLASRYMRFVLADACQSWAEVNPVSPETQQYIERLGAGVPEPTEEEIDQVREWVDQLYEGLKNIFDNGTINAALPQQFLLCSAFYETLAGCEDRAKQTNMAAVKIQSLLRRAQAANAEQGGEKPPEAGSGGPPVFTPSGGSGGPPVFTPSGAGSGGPPVFTPSGSGSGGPPVFTPSGSGSGGPPVFTPSGSGSGGPPVFTPSGAGSGGPPVFTPSGGTGAPSPYPELNSLPQFDSSFDVEEARRKLESMGYKVSKVDKPLTDPTSRSIVEQCLSGALTCLKQGDREGAWQLLSEAMKQWGR